MDQNPIRLHWLDPRNPREPFPAVDRALREPNGLIAIGGDLTMTRLLRAYGQGIFPWFNPDEPILWWSPDPRCVLIPGRFKVSRSFSRSLRRNDYAITFNRAPGEVLSACAAPRDQGKGTWLGEGMQQAYLELHRHGFCQSVEVWREGQLVGGLYGVSIGRAFFGESMFSRVDDGSKLALYWLSQQLLRWDFRLIDCQVTSPHLLTLGAETISRERFLSLLQGALAGGGRTGSWTFDIEVPAARAHLPMP
jgi:leucyl/phenylalanyl-tRNA--protein transferase